MDEEELHERINLLDSDAVAAWQARHAAVLLGWLRRRGVATADAEEIWNDALLATVRAAPGLLPRGVSLRRYAFGVARRQLADRLRRPRVDTTTMTGDVADQALRPAPVDQRRVNALKECVREASPQHRLIVELKGEGASTDEMAGVLRIDAGSVYQVWRRAKLALRECIEGKLR